MSLASGTRLGPYEIVSPIGKGGMGEVYRARDTNLGRDVAIKVLPEEFARDKERLDRFEREARLLAQVNHANIATLHGLEEHVGQQFLVMELVEGETLAERIAKAPIPVDEAIPLFIQIAAGLEAAHGKGIIHRDLKPANVKITPDGTPKVLDFGLAKARADATGAVQSESPTVSAAGTRAGIILGTPAYMSPEQARGKTLDKRTDIWSFGCCLYEALTGKVPFLGETVSDTIAAILKNEPDWRLLPSNTPTIISSLLRRCLQKDRERRVRDVGDARLEIEDALGELAAQASGPVAGAAPSAPAPSAWKAAVPWALTVVLLAVIVVQWILPRGDAPERARAVFSVLPSEGATVRGVAVSPEGEQLVFVEEEPSGPLGLWLRRLDSQVPQQLLGTSGAIYPFWSPDGQYVGFFADGKLKKVGVPGGPVEELAEASLPRGGTWNREGTIVFAPYGSRGLYRVAASGGQTVRLTSLDKPSGEDSHRYPSFLPDGRHVLYFARNPLNQELTGVWVASLEGETSQLLNVNSLAMYAPPGYLLYRRGGNLLAHPFDAGTLSFTGEPVSVADDVGYDPAFSGKVTFTVSATGLLAYEGGGIEKSELLWFDRSGNVIGSVGTPANYLNLYLSPDDSKLAVSRTNDRTEARDLWQYDLDSGRESQFTFNPASDFSPLWSPDATEIIFTSSRAGKHDIYS